MINFLLIGFAFSLLLWILFVNVMMWKSHRENFHKVALYLLYPVVGLAYVVDVLFNWTYASLIFLQIPKQATLSERLREILITDDGWRFKLALFVCKKMIEPWDFNHCGLGVKK